ncbi:hypothetical protein G845_04557 [Escherichia coli HVH 193 (4-3331423)]|nr:hypothetical protein G845_04557 [Escherichia coli HVH 193 (4-3331423)]
MSQKIWAMHYILRRLHFFSGADAILTIYRQSLYNLNCEKNLLS